MRVIAGRKNERLRGDRFPGALTPEAKVPMAVCFGSTVGVARDRHGCRLRSVTALTNVAAVALGEYPGPSLHKGR